jgi:hypothetical protein
MPIRQKGLRVDAMSSAVFQCIVEEIGCYCPPVPTDAEFSRDLRLRIPVVDDQFQLLFYF